MPLLNIVQKSSLKFILSKFSTFSDKYTVLTRALRSNDPLRTPLSWHRRFEKAQFIEVPLRGKKHEIRVGMWEFGNKHYLFELQAFRRKFRLKFITFANRNRANSHIDAICKHNEPLRADLYDE